MKNQKDIEQLLQTIKLYDNISLPYQSLNEDGCFMDVNPAWLKTLGYDKEEIIGKWFGDFLHPDWKAHFEKNFPEFKRRGYVHDVQFKIQHRDGHYLDISFEGWIGYYPDGSFKQTYCVFQDITERKKAEDTLKQSEKNYRDIFNNATDAIYIQDREGRFLDVNQGALDMYGYPKEFFLGKTPEFLSAPGKNDLKKIIGFVEDAFKGKPRQYDFWGIRKNGEVFPKIVRSQKGIYMGKEVVVTYALDITERKQAEEAIWESEEKYRSLTENLNVGVYRNTIGAEGRFIEANPAIVEMFGYKKKNEFLELNVADLYKNPGERKNFNKKLISKGFVGNEEIQLQKSDGTFFFGSVSAVAVKDENGKVKYYDGIIEDITERKKAEKELKKKMNELEIFNDAAVDRELIINEQRKEINELLGKLGKEPKYKIVE